MSQSQPDRLDRIEATLERVSQQLDNQVVVNAELRQTSTQLTSHINEIANAVSSLIATVNQHQENFAVVVNEIRDIRADMRDLSRRVDNLENP